MELPDTGILRDTYSTEKMLLCCFVVARELMNGITGTDFAPNASMTRAMFAKVLANLDGVDVGIYAPNANSTRNAEQLTALLDDRKKYSIMRNDKKRMYRQRQAKEKTSFHRLK